MLLALNILSLEVLIEPLSGPVQSAIKMQEGRLGTRHRSRTSAC